MEKLFPGCNGYDGYIVTGTHLDNSTKLRIMEGGYVDLAKLLPRDRVRLGENQQRMEIVNHGGQTFWVPMVDRDDTAINNYVKWEQAIQGLHEYFCKSTS